MLNLSHQEIILLINGKMPLIVCIVKIIGKINSIFGCFKAKEIVYNSEALFTIKMNIPTYKKAIQLVFDVQSHLPLIS